MKPYGTIARQSYVELRWRFWTALLVALSLRAWTGRSFCQTLTGKVTVSAGSSGSTSYLSIEKTGLGRMGVALPLSARNDFLRKLSITARTAIGNAEIDAGKLRMKALGYFSSSDRSAPAGDELLSVASLGAFSDPWGVALLGPKFTCAASISDIYSTVALQYRVLENPLHAIFGAGSLYEMDSPTDTVARFRPWLALGVRRLWEYGEAGVRAQLYPELRSVAESSSLNALRGAALAADLILRSTKIDLRSDIYIETGEFISASGALSSYDAFVRLLCGFDISALPLVRSATLNASAHSMSGGQRYGVDIFPAYGEFANPLVSRYWPDLATIEMALEGKRAGFTMLDRPLSGALACGVSLENERGSPWYSLRAKASASVQERSASSLSFEAALTGEQSDESAEIDASYSFSDIQDLEKRGESVVPGPKGARGSLFKRCDFSARFSNPGASLSCSIAVPIGHAENDSVSGKLRVSIKFPQCALEVTSSVKYAGMPKRLSLSSARLYLRIPF